MGKKYTQVSNENRKELIRLVQTHGLKIARAAELTGIYYPTAKAIFKVYTTQNRTQKITTRPTIKPDGVIKEYHSCLEREEGLRNHQSITLEREEIKDKADLELRNID